MIPTITDYLFILNRDRAQLELAWEKRKAAFLSLGIMAASTVIAILWIVYR